VVLTSVETFSSWLTSGSIRILIYHRKDLALPSLVLNSVSELLCDLTLTLNGIETVFTSREVDKVRLLLSIKNVTE
jgi:hypothetical protein